MAIYVVDQDVFDVLPQEAKDMIHKDGTVVSDKGKQEEVQEIIMPSAEEAQAPYPKSSARKAAEKSAGMMEKKEMMMKKKDMMMKKKDMMMKDEE